MKQELRKTLIERRKKITDKEKKDNEITANLRKILKNAKHVLLYFPFLGEPDILSLLDLPKIFYLPYCYKSGKMEARKYDARCIVKDELNITSSGIQADCAIDAVILPAIGANFSGFRLGAGKGYYDRFLENKNVLKIVAAYDTCLIDDCFQDEWDVRCDYVVTEKRIIKVDADV